MLEPRFAAGNVPAAIAQRAARMAATAPVLEGAFSQVAEVFVRIAADRGIPLDEVQVGAFMTTGGRIVISLVDPLALIAAVENLEEHETPPEALSAYFDDDDS